MAALPGALRRLDDAVVSREQAAAELVDCAGGAGREAKLGVARPLPLADSPFGGGRRLNQLELDAAEVQTHGAQTGVGQRSSAATASARPLSACSSAPVQGLPGPRRAR